MLFRLKKAVLALFILLLMSLLAPSPGVTMHPSLQRRTADTLRHDWDGPETPSQKRNNQLFSWDDVFWKDTSQKGPQSVASKASTFEEVESLCLSKSSTDSMASSHRERNKVITSGNSDAPWNGASSSRKFISRQSSTTSTSTSRSSDVAGDVLGAHVNTTRRQSITDTLNESLEFLGSHGSLDLADKFYLEEIFTRVLDWNNGTHASPETFPSVVNQHFGLHSQVQGRNVSQSDVNSSLRQPVRNGTQEQLHNVEKLKLQRNQHSESAPKEKNANVDQKKLRDLIIPDEDYTINESNQKYRPETKPDTSNSRHQVSHLSSQETISSKALSADSPGKISASPFDMESTYFRGAPQGVPIGQPAHHLNVATFLPESTFRQGGSFDSTASPPDPYMFAQPYTPGHAERVLMGLGFGAAEGFLPERFLRDWYNKIAKAQMAATVELKEKQSLANSLGTFSNSIPTQSSFSKNNVEFFQWQPNQSWRDSSGPSVVDEAATVLVPSNCRDSKIERLNEYIASCNNNVPSTSDERKIKMKQFANSRQTSLPVFLEVMSEKEEIGLGRAVLIPCDNEDRLQTFLSEVLSNSEKRSNSVYSQVSSNQSESDSLNFSKDMHRKNHHRQDIERHSANTEHNYENHDKFRNPEHRKQDRGLSGEASDDLTTRPISKDSYTDSRSTHSHYAQKATEIKRLLSIRQPAIDNNLSLSTEELTDTPFTNEQKSLVQSEYTEKEDHPLKKQSKLNSSYPRSDKTDSVHSRDSIEVADIMLNQIARVQGFSGPNQNINGDGSLVRSRHPALKHVEPAMVSIVLEDVDQNQVECSIDIPSPSNEGVHLGISSSRRSSFSLSPIPQSPVTVIEVSLDNQLDSLDTEGTCSSKDTDDDNNCVYSSSPALGSADDGSKKQKRDRTGFLSPKREHLKRTRRSGSVSPIHCQLSVIQTSTDSNEGPPRRRLSLEVPLTPELRQMLDRQKMLKISQSKESLDYQKKGSEKRQASFSEEAPVIIDDLLRNNRSHSLGDGRRSASPLDDSWSGGKRRCSKSNSSDERSKWRESNAPFFCKDSSHSGNRLGKSSQQCRENSQWNIKSCRNCYQENLNNRRCDDCNGAYEDARHSHDNSNLATEFKISPDRSSKSSSGSAKSAFRHTRKRVVEDRPASSSHQRSHKDHKIDTILIPRHFNSSAKYLRNSNSEDDAHIPSPVHADNTSIASPASTFSEYRSAFSVSRRSPPEKGEISQISRGVQVSGGIYTMPNEHLYFDSFTSREYYFACDRGVQCDLTNYIQETKSNLGIDRCDKFTQTGIPKFEISCQTTEGFYYVDRGSHFSQPRSQTQSKAVNTVVCLIGREHSNGIHIVDHPESILPRAHLTDFRVVDETLQFIDAELLEIRKRELQRVIYDTPLLTGNTTMYNRGLHDTSYGKEIAEDMSCDNLSTNNCNDSPLHSVSDTVNEHIVTKFAPTTWQEATKWTSHLAISSPPHKRVRNSCIKSSSEVPYGDNFNLLHTLDSKIQAVDDIYCHKRSSNCEHFNGMIDVHRRHYCTCSATSNSSGSREKLIDSNINVLHIRNSQDKNHKVISRQDCSSGDSPVTSSNQVSEQARHNFCSTTSTQEATFHSSNADLFNGKHLAVSSNTSESNLQDGLLTSENQMFVSEKTQRNSIASTSVSGATVYADLISLETNSADFTLTREQTNSYPQSVHDIKPLPAQISGNDQIDRHHSKFSRFRYQQSSQQTSCSSLEIELDFMNADEHGVINPSSHDGHYEEPTNMCPDMFLTEANELFHPDDTVHLLGQQFPYEERPSERLSHVDPPRVSCNAPRSDQQNQNEHALCSPQLVTWDKHPITDDCNGNNADGHTLIFNVSDNFTEESSKYTIMIDSLSTEDVVENDQSYLHVMSDVKTLTRTDVPEIIISSANSSQSGFLQVPESPEHHIKNAQLTSPPDSPTRSDFSCPLESPTMSAFSSPLESPTMSAFSCPLKSPTMSAFSCPPESPTTSKAECETLEVKTNNDSNRSHNVMAKCVENKLEEVHIYSNVQTPEKIDLIPAAHSDIATLDIGSVKDVSRMKTMSANESSKMSIHPKLSADSLINYNSVCDTNFNVSCELNSVVELSGIGVRSFETFETLMVLSEHDIGQSSDDQFGSSQVLKSKRAAHDQLQNSQHIEGRPAQNDQLQSNQSIEGNPETNDQPHSRQFSDDSLPTKDQIQSSRLSEGRRPPNDQCPSSPASEGNNSAEISRDKSVAGSDCDHDVDNVEVLIEEARHLRLSASSSYSDPLLDISDSLSDDSPISASGKKSGGATSFLNIGKDHDAFAQALYFNEMRSTCSEASFLPCDIRPELEVKATADQLTTKQSHTDSEFRHLSQEVFPESTNYKDESDDEMDPENSLKPRETLIQSQSGAKRGRKDNWEVVQSVLLWQNNISVHCSSNFEDSCIDKPDTYNTLFRERSPDGNYNNEDTRDYSQVSSGDECDKEISRINILPPVSRRLVTMSSDLVDKAIYSKSACKPTVNVNTSDVHQNYLLQEETFTEVGRALDESSLKMSDIRYNKLTTDNKAELLALNDVSIRDGKPQINHDSLVELDDLITLQSDLTMGKKCSFAESEMAQILDVEFTSDVIDDGIRLTQNCQEMVHEHSEALMNELNMLALFQNTDGFDTTEHQYWQASSESSPLTFPLSEISEEEPQDENNMSHDNRGIIWEVRNRFGVYQNTLDTFLDVNHQTDSVTSTTPGHSCCDSSIDASSIEAYSERKRNMEIFTQRTSENHHSRVKDIFMDNFTNSIGTLSTLAESEFSNVILSKLDPLTADTDIKTLDVTPTSGVFDIVKLLPENNMQDTTKDSASPQETCGPLATTHKIDPPLSNALTSVGSYVEKYSNRSLPFETQVIERKTDAFGNITTKRTYSHTKRMTYYDAEFKSDNLSERMQDNNYVSTATISVDDYRRHDGKRCTPVRVSSAVPLAAASEDINQSEMSTSVATLGSNISQNVDRDLMKKLHQTEPFTVSNQEDSNDIDSDVSTEVKTRFRYAGSEVNGSTRDEIKKDINCHINTAIDSQILSDTDINNTGVLYSQVCGNSSNDKVFQFCSSASQERLSLCHNETLEEHNNAVKANTNDSSMASLINGDTNREMKKKRLTEKIRSLFRIDTPQEDDTTNISSLLGDTVSHFEADKVNNNSGSMSQNDLKQKVRSMFLLEKDC